MIGPTVPGLPNDRATGISIRRATEHDAALLAALGRRLFGDTFAAHNAPEDMAAYVVEAFSAERQRDELREPGSTFWLAEDVAGEPAGYVRLRIGSSHGAVTGVRQAEVSRLYADRAHHGRGVGAALLARCVEEARRQAVDALWLGVWEHNRRAIAFYEKQGFRAVGEQSFTLGSDVQRDLVMALSL